MSYGVDYPNISTGNLYTAIDTYVATGSQTNQTQWPNGALNPPGSIWAGLPVQLFSQYGGFSSYFNPQVTVLGTTNATTAVTAVNNTEELVVGMAAQAVTSQITAGTTISAIPSSTTLTLSQNAAGSTTLQQFSFALGTKIFNGFPPVVKYVRYLSQNNPAMVAYPSVVYYTDATGTTVSGYAGEAFGNTTNQAAVNVNACAGVLLPNTTTGATAATLNGNWCWMAVAGLVPGVKAVASSIIGATLLASSSATAAFTVTLQAAGTNAYPYFLGTCMSNLSSNTTVDLLVNPALANL